MQNVTVEQDFVLEVVAHIDIVDSVFVFETVVVVEFDHEFEDLQFVAVADIVDFEIVADVEYFDLNLLEVELIQVQLVHVHIVMETEKYEQNYFNSNFYYFYMLNIEYKFFIVSLYYYYY